MNAALRKNMATLVEHRTQRIYEFGALMDQALPAAEYYRLSLLLCR